MYDDLVCTRNPYTLFAVKCKAKWNGKKMKIDKCEEILKLRREKYLHRRNLIYDVFLLNTHMDFMFCGQWINHSTRKQSLHEIIIIIRIVKKVKAKENKFNNTFSIH